MGASAGVHGQPPTSYRWAAAGDVNAFFGLMLDNVVNLAVLAGILVGGFGFPARLVYTRMFPGTALGVMLLRNGRARLVGAPHRRPGRVVPGRISSSVISVSGRPADRGADYLPLALPFAILTVIGGINVTESARIAGDDYRTRDILLTEAIATLIAGVCGGVSQSTPYIGHPAYKAMGGRAGYNGGRFAGRRSRCALAGGCFAGGARAMRRLRRLIATR